MSLAQRLPLLACFPALLISAAQAHAQAEPAALRSNRVSVYAAGQIANTDYGEDDAGYLVGGDFTHHLRFADLSLDLRFNHVSGGAVGEKSFVGGLKAERAYGRFHPYAQALFGYGVITYSTPIPYNHTLVDYDDSIVKDVGAGVDFTITHSFGVKLDGQYQFWQLGVNQPLTPAQLSVGLVYHLPYRFLRPRLY